MSEAAQIAGINKAIISTSVDEGRLKSNGKFRRERRINGEDLKRFITDRVSPITKKHPATFPDQLANWCIKLHGIKDNMIVLYPFLGTGSTLIAAKDLNVNGIGIELDQDYVNMAKSRISLHVVQ